MNSRDIDAETWERVRQCLVFYFSRRHGLNSAEDLAQETLMTLWKREDYQFEKEEDFLRVCYGFASYVLRQGYRREQVHAGKELDPKMPAPSSSMNRLRGAEIGVFLEEVRRIGKLELTDSEWQVIEQAATADRTVLLKQLNLKDANSLRVHLHRARKKLAKITGWR